jgi:hypothetical protein
MRKIILTLNLIVIMTNYSACQEFIYDPYCLKTPEQKRLIDEEQLIQYGFVSLDSIAIGKIREFMIEKGEILPVESLLQTIFSPFMYGIKPLINDSSNQKGIYRIKFSSSHSTPFLCFKNGDNMLFYDELIGRDELIIKILSYLNDHDEVFSTEYKLRIWSNFSDFLIEQDRVIQNRN